jgi:hypothetical protein
MNKSVADLKQEAITKYGTKNNTHAMFPLGTRVRVISPMSDMMVFEGETGVVIKNEKKYMIIVKMDSPFCIIHNDTKGAVQNKWNFMPEELIKIEEKPNAI